MCSTYNPQLWRSRRPRGPWSTGLGYNINFCLKPCPNGLASRRKSRFRLVFHLCVSFGHPTVLTLVEIGTRKSTHVSYRLDTQRKLTQVDRKLIVYTWNLGLFPTCFKPWPNGLANRRKPTQLTTEFAKPELARTRTCDGWPNGFSQKKVVNSTHIQLTCNQQCVNLRWVEKLASTCLRDCCRGLLSSTS